jgi:hypothetical protein
MTLSALFGVVLAAVGRDRGTTGSTPDDAPRIDESGRPSSSQRLAVRGGVVSARRGASIPGMGAMFAMVAPPRTPAR